MTKHALSVSAPPEIKEMGTRQRLRVFLFSSSEVVPTLVCGLKSHGKEKSIADVI